MLIIALLISLLIPVPKPGPLAVDVSVCVLADGKLIYQHDTQVGGYVNVAYSLPVKLQTFTVHVIPFDEIKEEVDDVDSDTQLNRLLPDLP